MKLFITLIFIFTFYASFGQGSPKTKHAKPTTATAMVKIQPDTNCTIYLDGEPKGKVATGAFLKLKLDKGIYEIKAEGENPKDVFAAYDTVKTTDETIFKVSLRRLIYQRLAREAEKLATEVQMVRVAGGSFEMGNKNGRKDEKPPHQVEISSFEIGKFEVTQAQWKAIMGDNPSVHPNCDDCPVENVTWDMVQTYINKLNAKSGKHYRLPTEAEWEYAARGGINHSGFNYSGSANLGMVAWYSMNSDNKTHQVGQKQPNELGIFDMTGNVWEWCQDWYSETYYKHSTSKDPKGPESGTTRVLRGGSIGENPDISTVSYRVSRTPGSAQGNFGFRLVLSAQ
ncbi:MAG TPA: formylglycine-generating enzyme family protein [Mucilaginibacter sp.]|jgi:formylglycine-generating enzyme required for sulfatase activity|nr:formylglycine-generating enzyme family protein [Mucilaginibacter sp.]